MSIVTGLIFFVIIDPVQLARGKPSIYANSLKFQRNEDDKSFIKDEIMFPQGENDALKILFEKTR